MSGDHDTPFPEVEPRIPEVEPSPEELAALEAAFEREFGAVFNAAHDGAAAEMEVGRGSVLERVRQSIDDEATRARRRDRRRHLRILFYVVNLVAVSLIVMSYVGTRAAIRLSEDDGHRLATQTEVVALTRALARRLSEERSTPVPSDLSELIAALRGGPEAPIRYPFDARRLQGAGYLDDYGRPYQLLVQRNQVLIYSVGRNGRDEGGKGDDLHGGWVTFVR